MTMDDLAKHGLSRVRQLGEWPHAYYYYAYYQRIDCVPRDEQFVSVKREGME